MSDRRGAGWMGPAGLILSVFVAGALTGAAGARWVDRRPPGLPPGVERADGREPGRRDEGRRSRSSNRFLEEITERLHLSDTQRTQIDSIVQAQRRRSREVMESIRPELSATLDSMNTAIEAVLDPEQRPEFEQILDEVRQRSDRASGPPRGGPPGGGPPGGGPGPR
ncbi:MAG: hypothetical protein R3E10_13855 [Gemmatimonadota bacterium]